jgi:hypothetical protein
MTTEQTEITGSDGFRQAAVRMSQIRLVGRRPDRSSFLFAFVAHPA